MGGLLRLAGQDVPEALQGNAAKITALKVASAEYIVGLVDMAGASSGLEAAFDALVDRGGAFVTTQMQATKAMENASSAADMQAQALDRLKEAQEDATAAAAADMRLGEREVALMAQRRKAAEEAATAIQGSFSMGEAIGGGAQTAQGGFQVSQTIQAAQTVSGLASAAGGGLGGAGAIAGEIGLAAGSAAAGPIVAAIVQIIELVTSIVPEDGGQGLLDQVHSMVMEFFGDLGDLPGVLAQFMQDTITEGIPAMFEAIPALVEGLIAAIPQLIVATVEQFPLMIGGLVQMLIIGIPKAILNGIGALFSYDLWKGLVDAMIAGFKEFFAPIFGNKDTGTPGAFGEGGYFDKVFTDGKERRRGERSSLFQLASENLKTEGSRATGDDYIPRTGLYLMHEGEKVAGNGRTMPTSAGASGGATIIVQGSVLGTIEDMARVFREAQRRGVSFG